MVSLPACIKTVSNLNTSATKRTRSLSVFHRREALNLEIFCAELHHGRKKSFACMEEITCSNRLRSYSHLCSEHRTYANQTYNVPDHEPCVCIPPREWSPARRTECKLVASPNQALPVPSSGPILSREALNALFQQRRQQRSRFLHGDCFLRPARVDLSTTSGNIVECVHLSKANCA